MGIYEQFKYISKYTQQPYEILISFYFINDYTRQKRVKHGL